MAQHQRRHHQRTEHGGGRKAQRLLDQRVQAQARCERDETAARDDRRQRYADDRDPGGRLPARRRLRGSWSASRAAPMPTSVASDETRSAPADRRARFPRRRRPRTRRDRRDSRASARAAPRARPGRQNRAPTRPVRGPRRSGPRRSRHAKRSGCTGQRRENTPAAATGQYCGPWRENSTIGEVADQVGEPQAPRKRQHREADFIAAL